MPEGSPVRPFWQQALHVGERLSCGRSAPLDAQAKLEEAGRLDLAGRDHVCCLPHVAGVEDLELRHHADLADRIRHVTEMMRSIDHHAVVTDAPEFIVATSRLQISGRSSSTCCTRRAGEV